VGSFATHDVHLPCKDYVDCMTVQQCHLII
jgi:hypothetical protein